MRWNELTEAKADPIDLAIKAIAGKHYGFSGQCGAFARALHDALGDGDFIAADSGDHYEYVDHILLNYGGRAYDGSGRVLMKNVRADYGREVFYIERDDTYRLVDPDGGFSSTLDEEACTNDLRAALAQFGFKA